MTNLDRLPNIFLKFVTCSNSKFLINISKLFDLKPYKTISVLNQWYDELIPYKFKINEAEYLFWFKLLAFIFHLQQLIIENN